MTCPARCVRCKRPMVTRARPLPGYVRHNARGLCHTCYGVRYRPVVRGTYPPGGGGSRTEVDHAAIERVLSGDRNIRLGTAELHAATIRLTNCGCPARRIAERLGITTRTVQRIRTRERERAA